MDKISQEEFEKAKKAIPKKEKVKDLTDDDFETLLKKMENPVDSLREIAVKIKMFLDKRIKAEMNSEKGILTDHTRRWVESYEKILEKIQKALHGDKSVNLHVHAISHGDIAAKMRESVVFIGKKEESGTDKEDDSGAEEEEED